MSTEPYTPDETEVATVWQAQYGDGDAGVGKTLRREGEESWARFIAKVKADALREAAAGFIDWDALRGYVQVTPEIEESHKSADYLMREADRIEEEA